MAPFPYDTQFRKLMYLSQDGTGDELFAELLRNGPLIHQPLVAFLEQNQDDENCGILLQLLAKEAGHRAAPLLMKFAESAHVSLRVSAAISLGWIRARAAIPVLDQLVGEDPSPEVREEALAALHEVLRDWPGMASTLRYHKMHPTPAQAEQTESMRLIHAASLPRILAVKYLVVPLREEDGSLIMAVRNGSEKRMLGLLSSLTGKSVKLEAWTPSKLELAIEQLYKTGDDDFQEMVHSLTVPARDDLYDTILAGIRLDEPLAPMSESIDSVEAAQAFLSHCLRCGATKATVQLHGEARLIVDEVELAKISRGIGERIMRTFYYLFRGENRGTLVVQGADGSRKIEFHISVEDTVFEFSFPRA